MQADVAEGGGRVGTLLLPKPKPKTNYCHAQRWTPTLRVARDVVVAGAEDERWQRIRFAFPR